MAITYTVKQGRRADRMIKKRILEAQALISGVTIFLNEERKRNEHSIMHKEPDSNWGDAGDMARIIEYLKDAESLLRERSQIYRKKDESK